MAGPTTQSASLREDPRLDPRGLLLRLAFADPGQSDLTPAEFEAAKAVVCGAGGLAYAYRVLDDAALLREHHDATPFDEDAPMHNALTELLLDDSLFIDEASEHAISAQPSSAPDDNAPAGLFERLAKFTEGFGAWRNVFAGGSLVAAATVALFLLPIDSANVGTQNNGKGDAATGAGVKAPHNDAFFTPPFHLVDAKAAGPISKALVLESLSRSVREFERCGRSGQRWTLSWDISPEGIASNVDTKIVRTAADSVANNPLLLETVGKCVAAVVTHTAFPFHATATTVELTLDRIPDAP